ADTHDPTEHDRNNQSARWTEPHRTSASPPTTRADLADPATMTLLAAEHLRKQFGGVIATDDVGLTVEDGEIHAVIGPNGAGKTTLIAQLAGELEPDAGRITFGGTDVTRRPAHERSLLGLARSFQITSIFREFTVLDNAALAVQAHRGSSFHFWRNARRDPALREPARQALAAVGLGDRADVVAGELAHGEQRQLEI